MKPNLVLILVCVSLMVYSVIAAKESNRNSCVNRCGHAAVSANQCQCNRFCRKFGDCCPDYGTVCRRKSARDSCFKRCGDAPNRKYQCQCNGACRKFGDCCPNYEGVCNNRKTEDSSLWTKLYAKDRCPGLAEVSRQLWKDDVNSFSPYDMVVNYQARISGSAKKDRSGKRLFSYVNTRRFSKPTYSAFIRLLDNYNPLKGKNETTSNQEQKEIDSFLDAILDTKVMNRLQSYLFCRGLVSSKAKFRAQLAKLWFDHYSRRSKSTVRDSSGFEHTMIGEFKNRATVSGFHNWISFYFLEKKGLLNYYGYVLKRKPDLVGAVFNWENRIKTFGSIFLGTSPEFDIALYTLCYFIHPGQTCKTELAGHKVVVKTFSHNGHIATAFVEMRKSN